MKSYQDYRTQTQNPTSANQQQGWQRQESRPQQAKTTTKPAAKKAQTKTPVSKVAKKSNPQHSGRGF